jgi:hypothetical protein
MTASQNAEKMIFSLTHILRNDPCRRFAFGITIEDDQLRLWLFARSGIMITMPVNWIEVLLLDFSPFALFIHYAPTGPKGLHPYCSLLRLCHQD